MGFMGFSSRDWQAESNVVVVRAALLREDQMRILANILIGLGVLSVAVAVYRTFTIYDISYINDRNRAIGVILYSLLLLFGGLALRWKYKTNP